MEKLSNAYNPVAAANVMCRNTISIGWDGAIYDCDFNQMLDLTVASSTNHISHFNIEELHQSKYRGKPALFWMHCRCWIELWWNNILRNARPKVYLSSYPIIMVESFWNKIYHTLLKAIKWITYYRF
jgi:hypothetical protein